MITAVMTMINFNHCYGQSITTDTTLTVTGTINTVLGSYVNDMSVGEEIVATFVYDTNILNADYQDLEGSDEPGHQYSSMFEFNDAPYGVELSNGFENESPIAVLVNNDIWLTPEETNGTIAVAGYYDWLEILGSTTLSYTPPGSEYETPANGEEWTFALFAKDSNWFDNGKIIPETLPNALSAVLIGYHYDDEGNEVGTVFVTVESIIDGDGNHIAIEQLTKVIIKTNYGNMTVALYHEEAPNTVANFLNYVNDGFYDGLIFHRVIEGFMNQGGGYNIDSSQKTPNAPIALEVGTGLSNIRGTIAMARTQVLDSATSQFFINAVDNIFLDTAGGGYAVFGYVTDGLDIVDAIQFVPTDHNDAPLAPVIIRSIQVIENKPLHIPKIKLVATNGTKASSYTQDIKIKIKGTGDKYLIYEKGSDPSTEWFWLNELDSDGYYHIQYTLAPSDITNKNRGTKRTVNVQVANDSDVSKTIKLDFELKRPKVASLKINGNNTAGIDIVPVTFKVDGAATQYYLSGDPDMLTNVTTGLIADLAVTAKGRYTVNAFDLSVIPHADNNKKIVYCKLANTFGQSKISKKSVLLTKPKVLALKVNGNNKTTTNNVPITFKVSGDALSYHISGDPDVLTDVTSGLLVDLPLSEEGVYTVANFDLSTMPFNSKGNKKLYVKLKNIVGSSKIVKTTVSLTAPKITSFKVDGNNKTTLTFVDVSFKFKGVANNYHISGDSYLLKNVLSGTIDPESAVNNVYSVGPFDLSTVSKNSKGKKAVYLRLSNEVGYSKKIKVKVTVQ